MSKKPPQCPVPVSPSRDRGLEAIGPQSATAAADIVLVHGIQGSSTGTWTHADYGIFWPDWLVEDIKNARVFTWSYDSTIKLFQSASSTASIDNYSDNLLADLANMRDETDSSDWPIFFVAHSLGGLVCANALVRASQKPEPDVKKVADMTRGILFLGTPHEGSDLARWANLGAVFLRMEENTGARKNIEFLMQDSPKLRELSENLATLLRQRGESGDPTQKINVVCFWEERPIKILKIKVVPRESAVIKGYDDFCIPGDHRTMARFDSKQAIGYKRVSGYLKKWVKAAVKAQQPPQAVGETYNMKTSGGIAIGKVQGGKQRFESAAHYYGTGVAKFAIEAQKPSNSKDSDDDDDD